MIAHRRAGIAWLELLLVLAFLALLFQVFPSLWFALDFRTWSRTTWFTLNLFVLFGLFGIRFGPDLYSEWRERRKRLAIKQQQQTMAHADGVHDDPDYEARVRRDADWRERAKRRLPWHQ